MDLSNLTDEQIKKLKNIAAKMNTTLEDLLKQHPNVNTLLESYEQENFGMLNEYDQSNPQVFND